MFRKPVLWVALTVVSLLGVALAVHLFPRSMPQVTLEITMDRSAALARASAVSEEHGFGPEGYRQAAAFGGDDGVQSYVELEGGGNEAFAGLLGEKLYSFYTWRVRHFKEKATTETLVVFTPTGEPYGFREKLPEDQPGAALGADEARRIAEAGARGPWGVDLGAFSPLEASQETRPGGRVDHTFVYERAGVEIGEATYRLRLVVSGDRFAELTHYVKIPEAFERRYAEMRSRNDLVASVSNLVVALLYGGGGIVGLFLLLRRRWVVWRPAVPWAAAVAVLLTGAMLSQWPLLWMQYDTAVSATSFAARQIIFGILNGFAFGLLALVCFVTGETLTRRAFPHHGQLWRLWSKDAARSKDVVAGTVGGYLIIGLLLGYLATLYTFAREQLGWWLPSSALSDPNIVANYAPWLLPLAISLQAGFIEEVLFRAIPLAGAVLLGQRFGGKRYWVAGALLLQAVLFGAVHANYPAQPAYARLVEIAIPFVFIGVIYMAFGLLPAIVMHFAFDVFMFSLPLFASSAPGIWVDQGIVVVLTMIPLWVVLWARYRHGPWIEMPDSLRNGAWSPPPEPEVPAAEPQAAPAALLAPRVATGLLVAGALGLVAWLFSAPFEADAPSLRVTKDAAVEAARAGLRERGHDLDESWKELVSVGGDVGPADRFVWQEGGPETYRTVIGSHIEAPHWQVRYARFEGDVAERVEEHAVLVGPDGHVDRVQHLLPEARTGETLSIDDARQRTSETIEAQFDLDPSTLREVSAEPAERPSRRDWSFILEDPAVDVGGEGEARIGVTMAGDEVNDYFRHVHVPEEWARAQEQRDHVTGLAATLASFPVFMGLLAGAVAGLVSWSRGRFARSTFGVAFVGLFAVFALQNLNAWPVVTAGFQTSQSWSSQAFMALAGGLVGAAFQAAFLAVIFGFAHRWLPAGAETPLGTLVLRGVALGAIWAGLSASASTLTPSMAPVWGDLTGAAMAFPTLGTALMAIGGWAMVTTPLLLLVGLAGWLSRGWARVVVLLLAGLCLSGMGGIETIPTWLASGLGTGLVLLLSYRLVLRSQPALLPLATGTMVVLGLVTQITMAPYPGAPLAAVLAIAVVGLLAVGWARRVDRDGRAAAGRPAQ